VTIEEHCLRRANHPGIVKLYASFRDEEWHYFTLELCPGVLPSSIFQRVKMRFRSEEIERWGCDSCDCFTEWDDFGGALEPRPDRRVCGAPGQAKTSVPRQVSRISP